MNVVLKTHKGYIREGDDDKITFVKKENATIIPMSKARTKIRELRKKINFPIKIDIEYLTW